MSNMGVLTDETRLISSIATILTENLFDSMTCSHKRLHILAGTESLTRGGSAAPSCHIQRGLVILEMAWELRQNKFKQRGLVLTSPSAAVCSRQQEHVAPVSKHPSNIVLYRSRAGMGKLWARAHMRP